jgi:hypothetical protein
MKKQTKNLMTIGFLLIVMVGGVFAQSYWNKQYNPLPLPEYKEPLPYNGDPAVIASTTNDESVIIGPVFPTLPSGLRIYPQDQFTENGKAEYKVVFTDNHQKCKPTEELACDTRYVEYKYKLSFFSSEGVYGEFEQAEFSVGAEESFSTILVVKTKNIGTSSFVISALNEWGKEDSYAKATITYKDAIIPDPSGPLYFLGQGYMASDNGKGLLVDMKIKTVDTGLVGIVSIDGNSYYVKGMVVGASASSYGMHVDLIEFNTISMQNGNVVGTFKGNLEYYDGFKVMKGILLEYQVKNWDLFVFGKTPDKTPAIMIEPVEEVIPISVTYPIGVSTKKAIDY